MLASSSINLEKGTPMQWRFGFHATRQTGKESEKQEDSENAIYVFHAVPSGVDAKAVLFMLREQLSPQAQRALCAAAFAIKHSEPVLFEGPTCCKATVAELLAFMLHGPGTDGVGPLTKVHCTPSTSLSELIGTVEPHSLETYREHAASWLQRVQVSTGKTSLQSSCEDLEAALQDICVRGDASPAGRYTEHVLQELRQAQRGRSFPFVERGLMQPVRTGGFTLLKNMNVVDPVS
eukprot:gb/GFBE01002864.1/.p1 GENE.gb/GFBE01002864.1/~~gb/GFBE01002864.1/.p1  ORF type:complete len:235 (+),score=35.13 gb/GFBE01002864.1/:1-705(+)